MGKKKREHIVFDGMNRIRKSIDISNYNKNHILKSKKGFGDVPQQANLGVPNEVGNSK